MTEQEKIDFEEQCEILTSLIDHSIKLSIIMGVSQVAGILLTLKGCLLDNTLTTYSTLTAKFVESKLFNPDSIPTSKEVN